MKQYRILYEALFLPRPLKGFAAEQRTAARAE